MEAMKKYLITVPDEITRVGGRKGKFPRETLKVTEQLILKALTMNDYHENLFFEGAVKVEPVKAD